MDVVSFEDEATEYLSTENILIEYFVGAGMVLCVLVWGALALMLIKG